MLDAAHIVPDGDEEFGQPDVRNGILMSRLYHGAYDADLLGVDPDGRVHVSGRLLAMQDGPTLEAIKTLHGRTLRPPKDVRLTPDRDRLARRFEAFTRAR